MYFLNGDASWERKCSRDNYTPDEHGVEFMKMILSSIVYL